MEQHQGHHWLSIQRGAKTPPWSYDTRWAATRLLDRSAETELARSMRGLEAYLRRRTLASPTASRLLREWLEEINAERLDPRRLMPRAKRGKRAVRAFLKKLRGSLRGAAPLARTARGRAALAKRFASVALANAAVLRIAKRLKAESRTRPGLRPAARELRGIEREIRGHRSRLVEANLRLVISIARRYPHTKFELSDLIQEGGLGLMRMADKFDPELGARFSTYATWWIRQSISRAIADQSRTIRIPAHVQELLRRIAKLIRRFQEARGRAPTVREISRRLRVSAKKIRQATRFIQDPVSLSAPAHDEDDSSLAETLEDKDAPAPLDEVEARLRREEIEKALAKLPERHAQVLRLRFGLNGPDAYTLREVGRKFRVSRERIRQIEHEALEKLRDPSFSAGLCDYYSA